MPGTDTLKLFHDAFDYNLIRFVMILVNLLLDKGHYISVCEQCGRVISVTAVRKKGNNYLSLVFRAFCQLDRAVQSRSGGNAHRDSFLLCQQLCRIKRILPGCLEDLVIDLRVQHIRNESGADSLNLMAAGSSL